MRPTLTGVPQKKPTWNMTKYTLKFDCISLGLKNMVVFWIFHHIMLSKNSQTSKFQKNVPKYLCENFWEPKQTSLIHPKWTTQKYPQKHLPTLASGPCYQKTSYKDLYTFFAGPGPDRPMMGPHHGGGQIQGGHIVDLRFQTSQWKIWRIEEKNMPCQSSETLIESFK